MQKRLFAAFVVSALAMSAPVAVSASEDLIKLQGVPPILFEDSGLFWRSVLVPLPPPRPADLEAQKAAPRVAGPTKKVQPVAAKDIQPPVVRVAMPTRAPSARPFWLTVGTGF